MTHATTVYLQPADLDSTLPFEACSTGWSKLAGLCRLLHRDGVEYQVTIMPHSQCIMVEARGQVHTKRQTRPPRYVLPGPPDETQARRGLGRAEAARDKARDMLVDQWSWWREAGERPRYDAQQRATRRKFGQWLASRLARRPRQCRSLDSFNPTAADYKSGDETFGRRLPRLSQLPQSERESRGWFGVVARRTFGIWWWRQPTTPQEPAEPEPELDETHRLPRPAWVTRFLATQRLQRSQEPSTLHLYWVAKSEVEYWREMLRLLGERREADATFE